MRVKRGLESANESGRSYCWLEVRQALIAQRSKTGLLQVIAIEHVVGIEWDKPLAVGMRDVDAGLLDAAEIEGLGVDEWGSRTTELSQRVGQAGSAISNSPKDARRDRR